MQCEILEYAYSTEWKLEEFLLGLPFRNVIQSNWPLVNATMSTIDYSGEEESWQRFFGGKLRNKPSIVKNAGTTFLNALIAEKLNVKKQVSIVRAACAGSLYALYQAALISLDTQTPVVVFCGDDFNNGYRLWQFNSIGAVDTEKGLPFDASSNGFRMGTGMAVMLVKHPSVKCSLDAKAVIQNFHFLTRPELMTHPGNAADLVNEFSSIDYDKIDLWNAHATGTPVGDTYEYNYFSSVCKKDIPIVGFKGYVGHCMSAAGAIEICMALDCKKANVLKPNIITGKKITEDSRIITDSTSFTYRKMLKTSFAFGGQSVVSEIDLI